MTLRSILFPLLLIILATPVVADNTYETVLIPIIVAQPVPGAYGSLWASELKVHADQAPVRFKQFDRCLGCLPDYFVPADATVLLDIGLDPGHPPGRLIYLARTSSATATFSLRIRDLSRESLTWGTELPVVRESAFRTERLTLFNIPTDNRFRVALRIYDVDAQPNTIFRVDVFDDTAGGFLASSQFNVRPNPEGQASGTIPSSVEITDLRLNFPAIAGVDTVRVVVTPVATARFWAFASVTNNETQHVTTITP
jgi:hypothetical protein